jgi:hypothetical protein
MSCVPPCSAITFLAAALLAGSSVPALAQSDAPPAAAESDQSATIADLQRQIDELKATVRALQAALSGSSPAPVAVPPAAPQAATSPAIPATPTLALAQAPQASDPVTVSTAPKSKPWYEKLRIRGYAQMRMNTIVAGDAEAPAGVSRLRTIGDSAVRGDSNFSFRRIRLVLQGDLSRHVSLYFQPDFAAAIANQSVGERREGAVSLRDMYADIFPTGNKAFRIRLGQSKVPFGWENMQSSSNRLALDRSDAINSAAPGERDIGLVAYYTPPQVQKIWDRLAADGQKLFGSYGAFGFGVFNGQGLNRTETDNDVMLAGLATWPFALDGLGLNGQVLELGGSFIRNTFRPEVRSGGVSAIGYKDNRVGLHAILYPQPLGLQGEWNWGTGPEFDPATGRIEQRKLHGGYIQTMAKIDDSPLGPFYPFARWQYYRGGYKGAVNAPRLETEELELGLELHLDPALELTATYGWASRKEPDERRLGRAQGQILRVQAQWNY